MAASGMPAHGCLHVFARGGWHPRIRSNTKAPSAAVKGTNGTSPMLPVSVRTTSTDIKVNYSSQSAKEAGFEPAG